MRDGYYETAIKHFEDLAARFPFGDNAPRAQLDLAYAYYKFDQPDQALSVLQGVGPGDALAAQARDVQVRILTDEKRLNEAYAVAAGPALARRQSLGELPVQRRKAWRKLRASLNASAAAMSSNVMRVARR